MTVPMADISHFSQNYDFRQGNTSQWHIDHHVINAKLNLVLNKEDLTSKWNKNINENILKLIFLLQILNREFRLEIVGLVMESL